MKSAISFKDIRICMLRAPFFQRCTGSVLISSISLAILLLPVPVTLGSVVAGIKKRLEK